MPSRIARPAQWLCRKAAKQACGSRPRVLQNSQAKQAADRFPALDDQKAIAAKVGVLIARALDGAADNRFREVQRRLRAFEEQFPNSEASRPIRQALSQQAEPHLRRARALQKMNQLDEAKRELKLAEEIYPYLTGVRDLRLDIEQSNHPPSDFQNGSLEVRHCLSAHPTVGRTPELAAKLRS